MRFFKHDKTGIIGFLEGEIDENVGYVDIQILKLHISLIRFAYIDISDEKQKKFIEEKLSSGEKRAFLKKRFSVKNLKTL